eukprot:jgi/Chrpa1/25486/Chrysochromulina_OHIO_Genome00025713-RA
MPITARANREAGEAEAGAAASGNSTRATVSHAVLASLQTILQHAAETFGDKATELSGVLIPINNPILREINWNSNPGNVVAALLHACGLAWSTCGTKLWRRADPTKVIEWRPPAKTRSLRPAAPRATTLDALDDDELQHDAGAAGVGTAAAQRAAEAARPAPPRVLERVRPEASDRLKRGSGWGSVPRPLARCCIVEQASLDSLVLIGQEHALTCGAPLKRVDGGDEAYYSSHSMGVVNIFRLVCDNGSRGGGGTGRRCTRWYGWYGWYRYGWYRCTRWYGWYGWYRYGWYGWYGYGWYGYG